MALAYYTTQISDNIEETPEGFLICRDVPIARTGWQKYKVSELPKAMAEAAGIDTSDKNASVDLYRDAEDVFSPETIASFEGKPVTDDHPPDFVTPETFSQYAQGHLQNVHKGSEPLENGEWPLCADLHITAEPLLSKVRNRIKREVSCGYEYGLRREGSKVLQVDYVGNHAAVVLKGRAGSEARINDAAPEQPQAAQPQPTTVVKEQKPVSNILRHLLGLGLKTYAQDAEPEKLAEAAEAVKAAGDKHADDAEPPAQADDKRKRMHDALDKAMDKMIKDAMECEEPIGSEAAMDRRAHDADLEELKNLLGDFFTEEEEEPEHAVDEEAPGEETEEDGEEVVVNDRARAADAATGATQVLRALRPFVARSNDRAVKEAFNTALGSISRTSKAASGGYGTFAATARARDKAPDKGARGRATDGTGKKDPVAAMQAFYDEASKGGK